MVFLNQTTMQMTAKIVYYGPGLCGKTTNLQWIHARTAPRSRGEMVSLETETDRTLFFDLLPLDVGVIGGMKVRLQLYTVPGQVFYNATRRLVLKGVDGVVFVADSQTVAQDANEESLDNLKANLHELGLKLADVPMVYQYNKRDLTHIRPLDDLRRTLNPTGAPEFEAAALHGVGVFETLKAISRVALGSIRAKVAEENRPREAAAAVAGPKASSIPPSAGTVPPASAPSAARALAASSPRAAASPARAAAVAPSAPSAPAGKTATRPAAAAASPRRASANPLSDLVPGPAEVRVEFAEEFTDKHDVRPVTTLDPLDIEQELAKLRQGPAKDRAAAAASREADRLVADLLEGGKGTRQEVKRKATVEVPEHALKGATGFRLNMVFEKDGREETVEGVLLVKLVGNTLKLDRLNLKLDLDLKSKS
jgi:signal recognition particle receptor subunit beta